MFKLGRLRFPHSQFELTYNGLELNYQVREILNSILSAHRHGFEGVLSAYYTAVDCGLTASNAHDRNQSVYDNIPDDNRIPEGKFFFSIWEIPVTYFTLKEGVKHPSNFFVIINTRGSVTTIRFTRLTDEEYEEYKRERHNENRTT